MKQEIIVPVFVLAVSLTGLVNAASDIKLSVSPDVIDVNLTETMTMTCSLMDHTGSVSHLVSIVITRNGSDNREVLVASVSSFEAAKVSVDQGRVEVNGTIQDVTKISANYLMLTWNHPDETQAAMYHCEINAIDKNARPVMFRTSKTVDSREATIGDIVHHVRVLEDHDKKQRAEIDDLTSRLTKLEMRLDNVEKGLAGAGLAAIPDNTVG